jgi:hypothetical protein
MLRNSQISYIRMNKFSNVSAAMVAIGEASRGKCICDQWAKGLIESICAECYLQKIVNKPG